MCSEDKNLKSVDEKVDKFAREFQEHGIGCGNKIAEVVRELHPNALVIVPLYRSCIVIEQSEDEKKEGECTLHSYADPHWLGGEIDVENLKRSDFHSEFCVQGDRQGPIIINKNYAENEKEDDTTEHGSIEEEKIFIENDEN